MYIRDELRSRFSRNQSMSADPPRGDARGCITPRLCARAQLGVTLHYSPTHLHYTYPARKNEEHLFPCVTFSRPL